MKNKNLIISEKIIDSKTKKGISGLKVEVWDKDIFKDDFLDKQLTNDLGEFQMNFTDKQFREWFLDNKPDLYFKIYHKGELIESTKDQVIWNYELTDKEIMIPIEWSADERYIVNGKVTTENNTPVPNFVARAYAIKIGKQLYLGEAITDDKGQYIIDYSSIILKYPKGQALDLQVKVFNNDTSKVELGKSSIILNAKRSEWINVAIPTNAYSGPSEFEQMEKEITKLIKPAAYSNLNEKDIDYMAAKLRLPTSRLRHFFHAWKLEEAAKEIKEDLTIPAAIFYGLFSDDEFPGLTELVQQNEKSLERALKQSVNANVISAELFRQINMYVTALKELSVLIALNDSEDKDNTRSNI